MTDELPILAQTDPPPPPEVPGLTSNQRRGALLDAEGTGRKEIAVAVGVSESAVAQWRSNDKYRAEVERLKAARHSELDTFFRRVRIDLLDGSIEAIATLRDALEATNKDGSPAWGVRTRAAQILIEQAAVNPQDTGDGKSAVAAAQASIQVTVNSSDVDVKKNEDVVDSVARPVD